MLGQQHIPGEQASGLDAEQVPGLTLQGREPSSFLISFQNDRGETPQGGACGVSFSWVLALHGICIGPSSCFPPLLHIVINQHLRRHFWLSLHSTSEILRHIWAMIYHFLSLSSVFSLFLMFYFIFGVFLKWLLFKCQETVFILLCLYFQHMFILLQNMLNDLAKEVAAFINKAITVIILIFNLQCIFMWLKRCKQKKFQATLNQISITLFNCIISKKVWFWLTASWLLYLAPEAFKISGNYTQISWLSLRM